MGFTIADGSFLPHRWTLANYRGIFQTWLFTRALVNSIGISLIATVLTVAVGSMAAYAVARLRFPGKQVLVAVTLLIAMFPFQTPIGSIAAAGVVITIPIILFVFFQRRIVAGLTSGAVEG
jgi:ABC-type glycerol-3-phosphate transport system permease component